MRSYCKSYCEVLLQADFKYVSQWTVSTVKELQESVLKLLNI